MGKIKIKWRKPLVKRARNGRKMDRGPKLSNNGGCWCLYDR